MPHSYTPDVGRLGVGRTRQNHVDGEQLAANVSYTNEPTLSRRLSYLTGSRSGSVENECSRSPHTHALDYGGSDDVPKGDGKRDPVPFAN